MPRLQLFVAYDGEKPVGRISAQMDRLRLEHHPDATGQFGFLEAVDDRQVFAGLLARGRSLAAHARSAAAVRGPVQLLDQ